MERILHLPQGIRLRHPAQPCPAVGNGIGASRKRRADAAVGACLAVGRGVHANRMGILIHGYPHPFRRDARQPAKRSPAGTARASPLLETGGGGLLGGNRGGGGGGECGVSVSEGIGSTAKRKAWKEKFIERFNDKRNIEAGGVVPPTGFKSKPTLACK